MTAKQMRELGKSYRQKVARNGPEGSQQAMFEFLVGQLWQIGAEIVERQDKKCGACATRGTTGKPGVS